MGASTAGDCGREVRDELTGGDGEAERGRAGARERTRADRSGPRDRDREGKKRARVGADRRDPPVRQRGRAGVRMRAGLNGLPWAEIVFPIFWDF